MIFCFQSKNTSVQKNRKFLRQCKKGKQLGFKDIQVEINVYNTLGSSYFYMKILHGSRHSQDTGTFTGRIVMWRQIQMMKFLIQGVLDHVGTGVGPVGGGILVKEWLGDLLQLLGGLDHLPAICLSASAMLKMGPLKAWVAIVNKFIKLGIRFYKTLA